MEARVLKQRTPQGKMSNPPRRTKFMSGENVPRDGEKVNENCCEKSQQQILIETTAFERGAGGKTAWMLDDAGNYVDMPVREAAKRWMAELGQEATEDGCTLLIRKKCAVERVWKGGLMLPPGIYTRPGGRKWLVPVDMPLWTPSTLGRDAVNDALRRGDNCVFMRAVKALFGTNHRRILYWLAGARHRIIDWRLHQDVGHALPALCTPGAQGVGKTLFLRRILPSVLGAPGVDVGRYLLGTTDFTPRMDTTPLLTVDDTQGALTPAQRRNMGVRIKPMQYAGGQEIHLKGANAVTLRLPWVIVIACNTDVNSLQAVPLMPPGDEDKLLIVPVTGQLPDNVTDKQRRAWDNEFMDGTQIQTFVTLLDYFGTRLAAGRGLTPGDPDADTSGRQYVRGGCPDEAIRARLMDIAPEGLLKEAICEMLDAVLYRNEGTDADRRQIRDSGIATRRLIALIQSSACSFETREAFRRQYPERSLKREGVENFLRTAAGVSGAESAHARDTVWTGLATLVQTEDEQTNKK